MTLEEAREKGYHFLDPSRFKAIETKQYLVKRKGDMGLIGTSFFQSLNQCIYYISAKLESEFAIWGDNEIYYELLGPDGEYIDYHTEWTVAVVVKDQ